MLEILRALVFFNFTKRDFMPVKGDEHPFGFKIKKNGTCFIVFSPGFPNGQITVQENEEFKDLAVHGKFVFKISRGKIIRLFEHFSIGEFAFKIVKRIFL